MIAETAARGPSASPSPPPPSCSPAGGPILYHDRSIAVYIYIYIYIYVYTQYTHMP